MAVESSVPVAGFAGLFGDEFYIFFFTFQGFSATFPPFGKDEFILVLSYSAFSGWNTVPPSEPKVRPGLGQYR